LVDERFGARLARQLGFTVTGTLGVLAEAAQLDLIPIESALERLGKTNFRRTPELFAQTLDLVRKKRG
jgi:predicted nucleic acid-binding protein